jgi:hypothetical protein
MVGTNIALECQICTSHGGGNPENDQPLDGLPALCTDQAFHQALEQADNYTIGEDGWL